jgi:hypothetical protein
MDVTFCQNERLDWRCGKERGISKQIQSERADKLKKEEGGGLKDLGWAE